MKYLQPLKNSDNNSIIDAVIVDEIFYQIPEILQHHELFLEELRRRLEDWDINQKVGDLFLDTFTKQTVIDTYTAFINNWKHAKEAIKSSSQSKPAFARFLENMAREHKGKLALDSLLIMPVQRIPRYELLIQTLLKHTEESHTDSRNLMEAQQAVHDLALTINLGQRCSRGFSQELNQLETLIEGLAGLASPERTFLSHDQVSITTSTVRKDRALFLFSDLLLITSIKRRSGTIKKPPPQSVAGNVISNLEGNKYKLLMKIPLDDLEIVKDENVRRMLKEMEQLSSDVSTLSQMSELCGSLNCPHSQLEDTVREMLAALNKQLSERHTADSQLSHLELSINTPNGVENIGLVFSKPEKRTNWEEVFTEAKNRLAASGGEKRGLPELVAAVPVRKTRAGLTFTCAGPTPSTPEVWVCNSDGYVGQVCVLSLARPPEPAITSCNGVCNARIVCIAPVPGQTENDNLPTNNCNSGICISVEDTDPAPPSIHLDSSSSSSDDEEVNEKDKKGSNEDLISGTMWLGTEDGCILIYNSTDNIRTKKNKVKIQNSTSVNCIIYFDKKVFVALANGDVTVYLRDSGGWKTNEGITITIGSTAGPVTKMVPVSGRLWCASQNSIKILNTSTLAVESTFGVNLEGNRSITCLVSCGLGAWISVHNSAKVKLYHAQSLECLAEVCVAPAVSKMLASCDDIIRQHKAACLRVTALLASRDLLWIGTSAGVILTMPIPHLTPNTVKISTPLNVSGVPHGHTGHVRFLTTVELYQRRGKHAGKPLIVSGGDGYEDFRSSSVSELAGREDSTNHVLLWQV